MTRTRIAALVLALPLVLAACGGGGSDDGGSGGEGSGERDQLIEQLRQEATDSGATTEELDCVMSALDQLDEAAIVSILEDNASTETEDSMSKGMVPIPRLCVIFSKNDTKPSLRDG